MTHTNPQYIVSLVAIAPITLILILAAVTAL